jgi:ribose transport system substrate-binding protein
MKPQARKLVSEHIIGVDEVGGSVEGQIRPILQDGPPPIQAGPVDIPVLQLHIIEPKASEVNRYRQKTTENARQTKGIDRTSIMTMEPEAQSQAAPRAESESLPTFDRRQRILAMLSERSSVRVSTLAQLFDVSETTIRNDLSVLERDNKLRRVHGGAVARPGSRSNSVFDIGSRFVNAQAKKLIARWAADMVQDGDSIFLDASTTVQSMAPFLLKYRNLSIVTTGIEIARILAENPSNTVVMIGGIVDTNGRAITSLIGAPMLKTLQFSSAFVSCVGLSMESGLTERNIEEARLKQELLGGAQQIIALVDSTKFGHVGLSPFAEVSEVTYLVTDSDANPEVVNRMQEEGISVTVCGEHDVRSYNASRAQDTLRIGFANLTEASQFAVDVRRGIERASQDALNVDLVVGDNQLDPEQAMLVADKLIRSGVDLAIEYQIDYRTGSLLMKKFSQAKIPVIAIDIPIVGATFFGVDNYQAGHMAGLAMGKWVRRNWDSEIDRLMVLIEPRAGSLPETRIHGQLDGLMELVGHVPEEKRLFLDGGNTTEISEKAVLEGLLDLESDHKIAVLSFNDDSALGAVQAARQLDREGDIAIVGQGADLLIRREIRRRDSRIIGSTAYFPEGYGEKLLILAKKILAGHAVPPAVYMEHVFISSENIDAYYPE